MDEKIAERTRPSEEAFAVLAEVAQVLADDTRRRRFRRNPADEVEGFELLPADMRETFAGLSDDELAALSKTCEVITDGGFFLETSRGRLCMF